MGIKSRKIICPGMSVSKFRNTRNRYKTKRRKQELKTAFCRSRKYTKEECRLILSKKYTDRQLALLLGRQTGAIRTKRAKLLKEKK